MAGKPLSLGFEVPPEERTPLVEQLLAVIERQQLQIEELRAEIDRLKGLPALPRRAPSSLNDPKTPPSAQSKAKRKRQRKRRPGGKRSKFQSMQFDRTIVLEPEAIPPDAKPAGFRCFHFQELELKVANVRVRRARYLLPNGEFLIAERPENLQGHFGPQLRAFVLHQYFHNQVTQPLLLEQLREFGVDISAGQVSRLLTEGHEAFHQEKETLLPAAREVSRYFQADDTPAKHQGQSGHTLQIGNAFFTSFVTTDTKSRVNFLKVLRAPYDDYIVGEDAFFYMECLELPQCWRRRVREAIGDGPWTFQGDAAWERRLDAWGLVDEEHRRIVTEAALFGSLLAHELYVDQPLLSDDAPQFKIVGFLHALCWLHAERHVARLIPRNDQQRAAYNRTRDAIWKYYQRLKAYQREPTPIKKTRLERDFDRLFQRRTGYPDLNEALRKIHARKEDLLLALERPELPLHNNLSENDIRQFAKIRKISGSARSDEGRRCRDTFLSLKTTCRKLGVSFWQYLQDRINGLGRILPLPELIRAAAEKNQLARSTTRRMQLCAPGY